MLSGAAGVVVGLTGASLGDDHATKVKPRVRMCVSGAEVH